MVRRLTDSHRALVRVGDGRLSRQTSMFVMITADPSPEGGRCAPPVVCFCRITPMRFWGGDTAKRIKAVAANTRRFVKNSPSAPGGGTGRVKEKGSAGGPHHDR